MLLLSLNKTKPTQPFPVTFTLSSQSKSIHTMRFPRSGYSQTRKSIAFNFVSYMFVCSIANGYEKSRMWWYGGDAVPVILECFSNSAFVCSSATGKVLPIKTALSREF